jgi:hypothetical protein
LIEVAIALVLLAVGVLALQALALSAGRSLGLAETNTRAANLVARHAEATLRALAADSLPADLDCELADGGRLSREITVAANGQGVRFEITLIPGSLVGRTPRFVIGYAFSPHGFVPTSEPDPCP